eukprot:5309963-Pyramimonas_sp.AAC.1
MLLHLSLYPPIIAPHPSGSAMTVDIGIFWFPQPPPSPGRLPCAMPVRAVGPSRAQGPHMLDPSFRHAGW